MASNTPGGQSQKSRHRITNIKLEPSTSNYDVALKILIDGQVARRLTFIRHGSLLSWSRALACDVDPSSRVEIRVYEKHALRDKRVGSLEYVVSTVTDKSETSLEFDTKKYTAVLSLPTPEEAEHAPVTALTEAQSSKRNRRLLDRLGPTRDALKTILEFGGVVAELHPAAKMAFGMCKAVWEMLEKQEQCDANVEKLIVGLAGMLPIVKHVKKTVELPELQDTVRKMMSLIEDASRFIIEYNSDGGPTQNLRAVVGTKVQDQVQDLLDKFQSLKEDFDRGISVQTLDTVDSVHLVVDTINMVVGAVHETIGLAHGTMNEVHEVILTSAQHVLLNELKPLGSARYDPTRACLSGTRANIIEEIVGWSQQRDASESLLWVYGHAGLGKSSIATSVCQELDSRKLLAAEFFCKRDSSERRDPQRVLTTIAYGLAFVHSGYATSVADAVQGDPRLCSSPIQMQYDNLIENPLKMPSHVPPITNLVVVVDALDECGTNEGRRQLLGYLHRMSQLVPWLRIVITSRPDPDIQLFFDHSAISGVSKRNVYRYDASKDIHSFIQHYMHSSCKSKQLPPNAADTLTARAEGLFIWAKTACELILNDHDPGSLFDLIVDGAGLDEGSNPLDSLYTTAIEISLGASGERGAQYVRECLGAIIVCSTRTPLSVASLSALFGGQAKRSVLQSVVNSLSSVLYTDHKQGGAVRVYHHSFSDYMTSSAPSRLRVDLERQNISLARCCLRTMIDGLRFNICGLETSHIPNSKVSDLGRRIDTAISLHLRYSCQYWTSHLTASRSRELEKQLREFLLQPTVLYWIEVLSLLGKLDVAMYSSLELSKWCEESDDVYQFAKDTYRFILAFYDPISHSTPHLYVSALAFCPTRTAFGQHLGATFRNALAVTRGEEQSWSPWLRCISHRAGIFAVAISKDGRRIVSGSHDNMLRVWDADTGAALGKPLVGHSAAVWSVGFSPDGRRIVSGSSDSTVRLWDADTGAALGSPLIGHSGWVMSVGFSPDGCRIVSGSSDKTVRVWDTHACTALGNPLVGHLDSVHSVGFSSDGRRIVSGSPDKTVRVWDADTGVVLGSPLVGHRAAVWSVAFSPDSRRIVSGSSDNTVRLWDADTGAAVGNPLVGHSGWVNSVRFSSDGRCIVSGSYDKTVRVWDADTGAAVGNPLAGHSGSVRSVGFSPDNRRIVSGSDDGTVRVWDADTSVVLSDPQVANSGTVWSVGFSPDGRRIISRSDDKTVRLWDTGASVVLGDPQVAHSGSVSSVGFSTDGRRIVSGSSDNTVRQWDADTGAALGKPLIGHSASVRSVGFSPDNRRIVSGSDDGTVRMWDADTGAALGKPLVGHSAAVWSVGFSFDGRRIISGSSDNTVRLWDADTGTALGNPLIGHSGSVNSVKFSSDGRRIVSASYDNTVRLWDADTGAALGNPLVGHSAAVLSVGFSPDGRCVVSGSYDKTVRVWDAYMGTALGKPLVGHSGRVNSVDFSPDGRRIASGSDDGMVREWDINTSTALGNPQVGHSGWVNSVRFSPDGRRIVSGSEDMTVRVWDSVPTLSASLQHDGWVCDKATGALLIWLPEEYRRNKIDNSLFTISQSLLPRLIDSSRFVHGSHWNLICAP